MRLLSVFFVCLCVMAALVAAADAGPGGLGATQIIADANADIAGAQAAARSQEAHKWKARDILKQVYKAVDECDYELFGKLVKQFKAEQQGMKGDEAAAKAAIARAKAAAPNDASIAKEAGKVEYDLRLSLTSETWTLEQEFKHLMEDCPKIENVTAPASPSPSPSPSPIPSQLIILGSPFSIFISPLPVLTPTPRPIPSGIKPGQTYSQNGVSPTPETTPSGATSSPRHIVIEGSPIWIANTPSPTAQPSPWFRYDRWSGHVVTLPTEESGQAGQPVPRPVVTVTPLGGQGVNKTQLQRIVDSLGSGTEQGQFLPPIAGPGATIFGTSTAENEAAGPQSAVVGTSDAEGHQHFYRLALDAAGGLAFFVPPGATALTLFRHLDANHLPDQGSTCQIVNGPAHIPNTQPLPGAPSNGPGILEAESAYELGGQGQGIIQLQTRGLDPLNAHVMLDNSTSNVTTVAASDRSVVAQLGTNTPLGIHEISVKSGNQQTNVFHAAVVTLNFQPLPKMHPGGVYPIVLNVSGVPPQVPARVNLTMSGVGTFTDGSTNATIPLVNGMLTTNMRVNAVGGVRVNAILILDLPDFRPKP